MNSWAPANFAEWYGLRDRGGVAPGRIADLLVLDDLYDFKIRQVFASGKLVAERGEILPQAFAPASDSAPTIGGSVKIARNSLDLRVPELGQTVEA